jgi:hypothetical protein
MVVKLNVEIIKDHILALFCASEPQPRREPFELRLDQP